MDCPSEEQLIRMKLSDEENITELKFDILNRLLTVYHQGDHDSIDQKLENLNFDTTCIGSETVEHYTPDSISPNKERKLLWKVFIINFSLFAVEIISGILANSMGLVADSLDMLADSLVYALALFVVGKSLILKKKVARTAGYFQFILAILGLTEVIRRYTGMEEIPEFQFMIIVSVFALTGNVLSLYLLQKSKNNEAHMQASKIFTSNDIVINLGVIAAGLLVYFTNSELPDLIIGAVVFFIVAGGAFKILRISG